MKLLVLLAVIAVAVMLWQSARRRERGASRQEQAPPPAATGPQDMVKCAHCPVHLPRGEAIEGPAGRLYCSAEHRRLSEG
ncbi:MAG: PP0621 family protein [Burkholderiaceae bacterium]